MVEVIIDGDLEETSTRRRLDFECDDDESIELLHSNVPKESIPRVGMEFETEEAAYKFYNDYAFGVGFSIRKSSAHKEKGRVLDKIYTCSCQGKRGCDKRDNVYKYHPRAETRFGCLAMLKVSSRQTGKFCVVNFIAKHNHDVASLSKAHLHRSHRKISASQASEVDLAEISGIAPKNAFEFMARQAGGRENLGFNEVDLRNYLRTRRKMKTTNTHGVLEYLRSMKAQDPSFYSDIQVDEDGLITNIFWADAKMMVDYEYFGDVVCFDTTYRKHKDARPIGLFVGVNHHRQTIVFGAALMYDEIAESFQWLYDTFSIAMGGKVPKTILTDQDAAMVKALRIQWPETYHRLCIWHIFQNAATHLSSFFAKYKDFSRDFSSCIYDHEYEDDFLDAWRIMLDKYEMHDNDWLKRMFEIKEKWAMVYGRDAFCADMTTTQRSESMNNVIKHYVNHKGDLNRFFENFQRLIDDHRYGEMVADFKANQSRVSLSFPVGILKHVVDVYTPAVYKLFYEEVYKAYDCRLEDSYEIGATLKYTVSPPMKQFSFVISYDSNDKTFCCTCRKFEFADLLCCHVLKVFSNTDVSRIPDKYILRRWTKSAKKGCISSSSVTSDVQVDSKTLMGRRYKELCRLSTQLVTQAAESDDGYTLVKDALLSLLKENDAIPTRKPMQSSLQNSHKATSNHNLPKDMPLDANGMVEEIRGLKVKPKSEKETSKRRKSALEVATKKKRPKKNTKQHTTTPSQVAQVEQDVQTNESTHLENLSSFNCPLNPYGYNWFTPLGSGQSGMVTNPLLAPHTQGNMQPSYMALLTSIGVSEPSADDGRSSNE